MLYSVLAWIPILIFGPLLASNNVDFISLTDTREVKLGILGKRALDSMNETQDCPVDAVKLVKNLIGRVLFHPRMMWNISGMVS